MSGRSWDADAQPHRGAARGSIATSAPKGGHTRRRVAVAAAFAVAVLAAAPVAAQVALYGAQPPKGAAFLRVVNAAGAALHVHSDFLPDLQIGAADGQRVGAYTVVERVAGRSLGLDAEAAHDSAHLVLRVDPGSYTTVIAKPAPSGGMMLAAVNDPADFNQMRARLSFYNATPDCAAGRLALQPGDTPVFGDVAPGTGKTRTVNPVQAQLRATCAGKAAPDFPLTGMETGNSYSIWLMQQDGQPVAFVSRDTTLPYKP